MKKLKNQIAVFLKKIISPGHNKPDHNVWEGPYKDWDDVANQCTGYNHNKILEKVRNTLFKVLSGEAEYERDSVAIYDKEFNWALLSVLYKVAHENQNEINLIDFGGSLGGMYFQHKKFFGSVFNLKWNIVEQKSFVEEGKKNFSNAELAFHHSLQECLGSSGKPHVVLICNSLQYLKDPYKFLEQIIDLNIKYLFFDSIAFTEGEEIITKQIVPEWIYNASYPSWFLNENKFKNFFKTTYDILGEFYSYHTLPAWICNHKAYWKGFLMKIK